MSVVIVAVLVFFVLAGGLGTVAYFTYQKKLRRAKAIERGLKMVPILIHLPPPSSDTQNSNRDIREVMREKTAQAEVLYNLIAGTATEGFKSKFYGQRHIALELIATDNIVHFYAAVPVALVSVIKKAIQTAYPGARLEEVEDHNIFNQEGRLAATLGGEMVLRAESAYPIATYSQLERDPMEAILTTVSALDKHDGVALQIMLRPANPSWSRRSVALADGKRKGQSSNLSFSAADLAKAVVKSPEQRRLDEQARLGGASMISNLELAEVEKIEEKTKHPGFEVLVRVLVSTDSVARSQQLLRDIATSFALFEAPGLNGYKFLPALDVQGLVTAFIFRFFPPELKSNVLNSVELATLFHLPDSQFTPSMSVERQKSKEVDGPTRLSSVGLLFGHNEFRGVKKEIRLSAEDRRRHTYILGQTGTGKSTMLENLAVQDMLAGNGFAFIDPHGDSAEKLLALVPKIRAEDVIYFNPADTEYPMGLNLFEFNDPTQKDFIVQETINMLYKLYDPGHTGIIGPRYEHWYRNAALTLMSDPNGSSFIEVPKVFTDTEYLKKKFKYLRDPTVIDFWTKEMGQTSDYHKSEMLGWFVSKFGAFQNNEMMRNIIGQTKSSFNIRDVMDQKKILIVNLSKGRLGELNSQLLGMIFVIKFQAAAMSRADIPEDQRNDFSLYVDEFQNFSTDSFASILSEARKYRLNLIVANQFIGQLSNEIRDAVFGNIGTIVAHRMGPEDAEFMVKQFAPVFDVSDLVNIPNYNAAMRLMIGGLPSQPFTVRDSAPIGTPNLELGLAIKQLSAAKYGHARATVEADIATRLASGITTLPAAPGGSPAPAAPSAPEPAMPTQASALTPALAPAVPPAPAPIPAPALAPTSVMPAVIPEPMVTASPAAAIPTVQSSYSVQPTVPAASAIPTVSAVPNAYSPMVEIAAAPINMASAPMPVPAPAFAVDSASPVFAQPAPVQLVELPQVEPIPAVPASAQAQPVWTTPPSIIPEPNAEGEADAMTQAGGFTQMGSALAAPPVVAEVPVAELSPETEPPVEPVAIGAPMAEPPVPAPVEPEASPEPVLAPISEVPPIGAPPVELKIPPVSSPGTLSVSDITGGNVPVSSTNELQSVPLLSPESGQPKEDDPYARVDILGGTAVPAVPVVSGLSSPQRPVADVSAPQAVVPEVQPEVATPATQPVANPVDETTHSYDSLDVLGAAPLPLPASEAEIAAALAPTASVMPVPPVIPEATAVAPAVDVPQPPLAPITAPSVPEASTSSMSSVNELPTEPMVAPEPPAPEPVLPEEPLPESPIPAEVQPTEPEAIEEPRVTQPQADNLTLAEEAPAAEVVSDIEPPVDVQASSEAKEVDNQLIHFTDPSSAQAVLERTEVPRTFEAENNDKTEEPDWGDLPEGVKIVGKPSIENHSMPPAPQPIAQPIPETEELVAPSLPAPEPDPMSQVESVADMLEEVHEERMPAPPPSPKPQPKPVIVPKPEIAKTPTASSPVSAATRIEEAEHEIDDLLSQSLMKTDATMKHRRLPAPIEIPEATPEPVAPPQPQLRNPIARVESARSMEAERDNGYRRLPVAPAPVAPVPSEPTPAEPAPRELSATYEEPSRIEEPEESVRPARVATVLPPIASQHRRLPEKVKDTASDDDMSGINLALAAKRAAVVSESASEPVAEHHGLKVIQPLESIVPSKERFARELASMNKTNQAQASELPDLPASNPRPEPEPIPRPVYVAPAAPPVEYAKVDIGLPPAESLAADDVAKARAEREAQVAAMQRPQPSSEPEPIKPSPEDIKLVSEPAPIPAPTASEPRRKRKRERRREKPVERAVEAPPREEVRQPEPVVEPEPAAGPVPGKLIMPTTQKPSESTQQRFEKPKKLAPGEVYVDESGNVIIGD